MIRKLSQTKTTDRQTGRRQENKKKKNAKKFTMFFSGKGWAVNQSQQVISWLWTVPWGQSIVLVNGPPLMIINFSRMAGLPKSSRTGSSGVLSRTGASAAS